jgi:hypothetical protein
MLPRVAFGYGHVWSASSNRACASSRSTPGRLTEASSEEVTVLRQVQIHFSVDCEVVRQGDLQFPGHKPYRTFETGRPTSGKQLLRIGAVPRGPGGGKFDIETAIGAAGHAIFLATCGMGLGRVQQFFGFSRSGCLSKLNHGRSSQRVSSFRNRTKNVP